jgi:hypothetical protein
MRNASHAKSTPSMRISTRYGPASHCPGACYPDEIEGPCSFDALYLTKAGVNSQPAALGAGEDQW